MAPITSHLPSPPSSSSFSFSNSIACSRVLLYSYQLIKGTITNWWHSARQFILMCLPTQQKNRRSTNLWYIYISGTLLPPPSLLHSPLPFPPIFLPRSLPYLKHIATSVLGWFLLDGPRLVESDDISVLFGFLLSLQDLNSLTVQSEAVTQQQPAILIRLNKTIITNKNNLTSNKQNKLVKEPTSNNK